MKEKITELRKYVQFSLYTVNDNYCIQLFPPEVCANDLDISTIWEDSNNDIEKLIDEAIAWCEEFMTKQATAIFRNIYLSDSTVEEKREAIKTVLDTGTYNSMTKQEILNALDWLYQNTVSSGLWGSGMR